jgi:hypothetical protein
MSADPAKRPSSGTLGSRVGDWTVCWLGGWSRHRLYYLLLLVGAHPEAPDPPAPQFGFHSFNQGKPSKSPRKTPVRVHRLLTEGL